ncbi:DUF998 domain-containing protein [Halocatena halophila]|uniref:DUF998 domain-containing protein n=1 Tax=Halocatena halophila TaxID=2814576 RepID=UPI002ECFC2A7
MDETVDRIGPISGIASPVVALGAIGLATTISQPFSWTDSALSDLGVTGGIVSILFNGGVIAGGVIAVPFGLWLLTRAQNRLERMGVCSFWLTAAAMAAIGLFPMGSSLHIPVAVSFYLLLSGSLWLYGIGNVLDGRRRRGYLTIALGIVNLGGWIVWGLRLRESVPGLALPETVGALALAFWVTGTAVRP